MKLITQTLIPVLLVFIGASQLQAQCGTWNEAPNSNEIQEWHVVYRQFVKGKQPNDLAQLSEEDFNIAYNNWKKCYDAAPNADGQRPFHFIDGRKLLKAKALRTDDASQKAELGKQVIDLYEAEMACYPDKKGYLLGRKAFDMFYTQGYGFTTQTLEAMEKALEVAGNDTEYILIEPLAQLMAYLFKAEKVEQPRAQETLSEAFAIAEYNIENNERYSEYYKSALARAENQLSEVRDDIFDCEYFRVKLMPQYEANPDSLDLVKYVIAKLKSQGCDPEADYMVALDEHFKELATQKNAQLEADRRARNPGYDATQLQKEGKYDEAVVRYLEAAEMEEDPSDQAQYYYSVASIQTWQLNQYSQARSNARKAADLREDWGKPYILMGDIYAKLGRINCDDWNARLAILAAIDKYQYAKSIDSEVSQEASSRIANYSGSIPQRQEGFMRKIKEGQVVTVGCGIGEKVRVRYQ